MSDSSDQEAVKLFADYGKGDSKIQDASQSDRQESYQQRKKSKKKNQSRQKNIKKKHKKDKKIKRKNQSEENSQEQSVRPDIADLIDSMAEEDSQEQQSEFNDSEQEIAERDREYYNQLYGVNKKRATEQYLAKFDNKGEQQINKMYERKVNAAKKNAVVAHTSKDPEVYMASCYKGQEEAIALALINKASYCQSHPGLYYCQLISAFASKKKFPGRVFIEANSEKQAKDSLEGLATVNAQSVKLVDYQIYSSIFQAAVVLKASFEVGQLVRVRKGLYTGDLAKIHKMHKHRVQVLLVPRMNLQFIKEQMRRVDTNLPQGHQIIKKNQIFKKYTGSKLCFDSLQKRPSKVALSGDAFQEFRQLPQNKKITLTPQGLIILGYSVSQIEAPQGTILPIELEPFSKSSNILQQLEDVENSKIQTRAIWKVGQQATVSAGELKGCYGKIIEIIGKIAVLKCENIEIKNIIIQELVDHLDKRFAVGQRVLVVEGKSKGTEGLIIKQEGSNITIWTDNNNELIVSALNLQIKTIDMQGGQNILGLKRQQLIKTIRGSVAIIIATNKDSLKILDTLNIESVISNIEYKAKIAAYNVLTKSKFGEIIERECLVKIVSGDRKGSVCEVKRIYQNYVFMYSSDLRKSQGYCVQNVDNCLLVNKSVRSFGGKTRS